MLNLTIISVGKMTTRAWIEAETTYLTRLKPYAKVNIVEISEEKFSAEAERAQIQRKEATRILAKVPKGAILITLHEAGKSFTSPQLAKWLNEQSTRGEHLVFVLGGPLGLHQDVLNAAHLKLSLSPLTFPHQLARVILDEQLYRTAMILIGKAYHY